MEERVGDAVVAGVPKLASDAVDDAVADDAATAAAVPTECFSSHARLIPSRLVLPGSLQMFEIQTGARPVQASFECLAHSHPHHDSEVDAVTNAQDYDLRPTVRQAPARAMIEAVVPQREPLLQPPTNA